MIVSRWALIFGLSAALASCQKSEMKSSNDKVTGEQAGERTERTPTTVGGGKSVVKTGTDAFDNPIVIGPETDSRSMTQLLCQEGPQITTFADKSDFSETPEFIGIGECYS